MTAPKQTSRVFSGPWWRTGVKQNNAATLLATTAQETRQPGSVGEKSKINKQLFNKQSTQTQKETGVSGESKEYIVPAVKAEKTVKTAKLAIESVAGGDMHDCLSAAEIDRLVGPYLGGQYIHARMFYDARTATLDSDAAVTELGTRLARPTNTWSIMPVHVRHHWATAVVTNDTATIFDSAPSPITAKDFAKTFRRLGRPAPVIICHARQPRGSNQCGLHVVLVAILAKTGRLPESNNRAGS